MGVPHARKKNRVTVLAGSTSLGSSQRTFVSMWFDAWFRDPLCGRAVAVSFSLGVGIFVFKEKCTCSEKVSSSFCLEFNR
jgi:hypothetical protein